MKIKFFNPELLDRNLKATVHKSGKMGFTIETANKMGLGSEKSLSIGINEDNEDDKDLYVLVNEKKRKDAFSVLKAGGYYYVNTKPLFNSLKLDYIKNSIMFDVTEDEIDNIRVFKFKIKIKERINK